MKKFLPIVGLVFLLVFSSNVSAQVTGLDAPSSYRPETLADIPHEFVYPTSPFYFLKEFKENTELLLSFRPEDRFKTLLRISRSRLAESDNGFATLRFEVARKSLDRYNLLLRELNNAYKTIANKDSFKVVMTNDLEGNVSMLSTLATRYPEKSSLKNIHPAKDNTREVIYENVPTSVRTITPLRLDNLKSFNYIFDIRNKIKFDGLHVPQSIWVPLFLGDRAPLIPNEKFGLEDYFEPYKNAENYLIIGNFTEDARQFARRIVESSIGANKTIYILEGGFVNYAMSTDFLMEGTLMETGR